jgi:hypothetical protein
MVSYQTFPITESPPTFANSLVQVFRDHETSISTANIGNALESNKVLEELRPDLTKLGFLVEKGKRREQRITRPVLFGENGRPVVNFDIDSYQPDWQLVLEIEAGRAWMGNAVHRDIIRACVMVDVRYLALAVPIRYSYSRAQTRTGSPDYSNTKELLRALYSQDRFRLPYKTILIGY